MAHRGGKGRFGTVLTAETCAKLSKAMMGKKHTLETRAKRMAQTGKKRKKHTIESLAKTKRAHTKKGRVK